MHRPAPWEGVPADSEHNGFGEPVDGYFRWYQIGNRDGEVTDYQQDYMVGLRGYFGESAEWEVSYHKARLDYRSVGRYYLSYAGLYTNEYFDIPLGSETGVDYMRSTIYTENINDFEHINAGLGFAFGELPGGQIQHYVGGEFYDQGFASKYDAQSEAGLIGGSAGNSAAGQRDTTALFYEASLPVTDQINVSAAHRWDDYSDFGSQALLVKAEYRPTADLLLRASWSEGFRAPSLSELLAATSFSATFATDYVACRENGIDAADCPERQFDNLIESNSNLGPEESTLHQHRCGLLWYREPVSESRLLRP